jgi:hypothetical protein
VDKHKLTSIFLPTLAEALERIDANSLKLAHYTRFDVAKLILNNRSVWMRNARMMNDIGEIDYGISAMDYALAEHGDLLNKAVSAIDPGMPSALRGLWNYMRMNVVKDVFISCMSEHWPTEDPYGRLSMWRAYGDPDGVCLVLNVEPFRLESNALNAYSSPVFYGEPAQFSDRLKTVLTNVGDSATLLKSSMTNEMILSSLGMAFLFGAVCLKHPGFAEEQEWRVIHMPNILQPSLLRRRDLKGPPAQTIFEILLEDAPSQGLVGLTPDALIHRVIIGPSNHSGAIAQEMSDLLRAQGVRDADTRIVQSGIPLRV